MFAVSSRGQPGGKTVADLVEAGGDAVLVFPPSLMQLPGRVTALGAKRGQICTAGSFQCLVATRKRFAKSLDLYWFSV